MNLCRRTPASVKDGFAVVASDGPGEYPVIAESRAGNDGLGITVTPGTVAYVTTGGKIINIFELIWQSRLFGWMLYKCLYSRIG